MITLVTVLMSVIYCYLFIYTSVYSIKNASIYTLYFHFFISNKTRMYYSFRYYVDDTTIELSA